MGLLVIAGLAYRSLRELIACDLEDYRLKLAKEMGATSTINSKNVDVIEEVKKITNGRMCDVVYEGIGHPIGVTLASKVIRQNGKILLFGYHGTPNTYDLRWVAFNAATVYNPHGTYQPDPRIYERNLETAIWAVEKGIYPMKKVITHKFKLDELNKAYEMALGRTAGYIKGVVVP